MTRTRSFQGNRSQAVRLPRDVAFAAEVQEAAVIRDGAKRVILPADAIRGDFFPGIDLGERARPEQRAREAF